MNAIVSDDSSEGPESDCSSDHSILSVEGLDVVKPNDPEDVKCPRFNYIGDPRWARGKYPVTFEVKTLFTKAASQFKVQFFPGDPVVPAHIHVRAPHHGLVLSLYTARYVGDFLVFVQNGTGHFDMTHSTEVHNGGYYHPLHPLFHWKSENWKTRFDGKCVLVRTEEEEDDTGFRVYNKRFVKEGRAVLMECGDIFSSHRHSKYVKKWTGKKDICSAKIPIACLESVLDQDQMNRYHDQHIVVETGSRGNISAFLRDNDQDPNLKPGVVLDLKTAIPSIVYLATRDIPAGEELTIPTGTGFAPFPWTPPPVAPAQAAPAPQVREPSRKMPSRAAKKARV